MRYLAILTACAVAGIGLAAGGVITGAAGAKPRPCKAGLGCTTTTVSTSTTTTTATSSTMPLPTNPGAPRQLGVTLAWSSSWSSDLVAYSARVGRVPSVVQTYRDMQYAMLNPDQMNTVAAMGALPLVTIEPWDSSSITDPRYTLKNIIRGDFDAWFRAGADTARTYGKPFYLRFAPEMNGAWAPWEAGINGNTPQEYVNVWRHVHAIFVSAGATNAIWVWSPNVFSTGGKAVDFTPYYPGSDMVDVLGLDGYNWGSADVWQTWTQVFGNSYVSLCALDPSKPVIIAETASAEAGGDKAAWITSAYTREIPIVMPRVKIVLWFDEMKETDWRVESSVSSLGAYRSVATSSNWG
jgi:hypothetical protein